MNSRSKSRRGQAIDNANDGQRDTQFVSALARGVDILLAFKATDSGLGNQALAERTGLALPTVSRLAYTLMQKGLLEFDQQRRDYRLGIGAVKLGSVALATTNIRTIARPMLKQLAEKAGFNVGMGLFDNGSIAFTDVFEGGGVLGLRLNVGYRIPVLTTAMGKAYLASLSSQERDEFIRDYSSGKDSRKIEDIADRAKKNLQRHGFCAAIDDWQAGVAAVAKPLRTAEDQRVWVCMLGGPSQLLSHDDLMHKFGPQLDDITQAIEGQLVPG